MAQRETMPVAFIVNVRADDDFGRLVPPIRPWRKTRPGLYRTLCAFLRFLFMWITPFLGVSSWMRSRDTFREIVDFRIFVTLMVADQMKKHPRWTQIRVQFACLWAALGYGCKVIVLGAYTSPFTHDGEDVRTLFEVLDWLVGWAVPRLRGVIVTHGDTYSACVACEQAEALRKQYQIPRREVLAIVGATGIIGNALARYFAQKRQQLLVIGRTPYKLRALLSELEAEGFTAKGAIWQNGHEQEEYPWAQGLLKGIRFGVAFTSHPGELITAEYLNPQGSAWGDGAQPNNLGRNILTQAPVAALDLSIVESRHYPARFGGLDIGNPEGCLYACGSEGIVLAYTWLTQPDMRRKLREMHLTGEISVENMEILRRLAKKAEVGPARPSWFGKFIELPSELPHGV